MSGSFLPARAPVFDRTSFARLLFESRRVVPPFLYDSGERNRDARGINAAN